jgi:hypothetical protein
MDGVQEGLVRPVRGSIPLRRTVVAEHSACITRVYFLLYNKKIIRTDVDFMVADFSYEVTEKIAVLSESSKGWTKELNLISWNGRDPKYDIREWSPDGSKMGKGITLSDEEVAVLKKALDSRNL